MTNQTLQQIVERDLKARGLAGLKSRDGSCACHVGDLMPCGAPVPRDCHGATAEEMKGVWAMRSWKRKTRTKGKRV